MVIYSPKKPTNNNNNSFTDEETAPSSLAPHDYLDLIEDRSSLKVELIRALNMQSDRFVIKYCPLQTNQ